MYCRLIFFILFLAKYWIYNTLIDNIDIETLYISDKSKNISIFDILKRVEVIKNSRTIGIRYSYTYTTSWSGFYAYSVRRQTCMHRVQGVINNNRKLKWIYAPCRQKTLRVNLVCLQNQHRQNKSYKLSIKLHRVRR